jgi:hypothetical protein
MKNACSANHHASNGCLFSYRNKFTLLYSDMLRYDIAFLAGGRWSVEPPDRDNHLQMSRADAVRLGLFRSGLVQNNLQCNDYLLTELSPS